MPRVFGHYGRPTRRVVSAECCPRAARVPYGLRVRCDCDCRCAWLLLALRAQPPTGARWAQWPRQFVDTQHRYLTDSSRGHAFVRFGRQRAGAGSSPRCRCDSECRFADHAMRMTFFLSNHSDVALVCHGLNAGIPHVTAIQHRAESLCQRQWRRWRIRLSSPTVAIRRRPARSSKAVASGRNDRLRGEKGEERRGL